VLKVEPQVRLELAYLGLERRGRVTVIAISDYREETRRRLPVFQYVVWNCMRHIRSAVRPGALSSSLSAFSAITVLSAEAQRLEVSA
jgi:hypothetical protein